MTHRMAKVMLRHVKILSFGVITAATFLQTSQARAELKIGAVPKIVKISGEAGGRVSGEPWSSEEIKDKVIVLFYVDPDEKDLNDATAKAIKGEEFDRSKFSSVAVINMAASWAPNFIIQASLEAKQKEFADTIYVKDKKKILVSEWNLKDDSSDIVLFDKTGKVLFSRDGLLSAQDTTTLVNLIKQQTAAP